MQRITITNNKDNERKYLNGIYEESDLSEEEGMHLTESQDSSSNKIEYFTE